MQADEGARETAETKRAFKEFAPFIRELSRRMEQAPYESADYKALHRAATAIEAAATHFTGDRTLYWPAQVREAYRALRREGHEVALSSLLTVGHFDREGFAVTDGGFEPAYVALFAITPDTIVPRLPLEDQLRLSSSLVRAAETLARIRDGRRGAGPCASSDRGS